MQVFDCDSVADEGSCAAQFVDGACQLDCCPKQAVKGVLVGSGLADCSIDPMRS